MLRHFADVEHPSCSDKTGISTRSTHTELRIRGRPCTRVQSSHSLRVIHLPLSHLRQDLSLHHYDSSPHHPLDKQSSGSSVLEGVEFHISAPSLSVPKSLHTQDETSITQLYSNSLTCLRTSHINKHSLLLPPPFYILASYNSLASLPHGLTLTLTLTSLGRGSSSRPRRHASAVIVAFADSFLA